MHADAELGLFASTQTKKTEGAIDQRGCIVPFVRSACARIPPKSKSLHYTTRGAESGSGKQLAQHELQDAVVAVVFRLVRRLDTRDG